MNYKELFPYKKVRRNQEELMNKINEAIIKGSRLIAHAPTGLGKTVASLTPAINHAISNGLTVFFLTPRHSQHNLVIKTIKDISEKGVSVPVVDLIGRHGMCVQQLSKELSRPDFTDYCKDLRERGACKYYKAIRSNGLTSKAEELINSIINGKPLSNQELIEVARSEGLCPYEVALELAKNSRVIICDYFHLFSPEIKGLFLNRINKRLEDSIIIIDEAHNLPSRVRSMISTRLTEFTINNSIKELINEGMSDEAEIIRLILRSIESLISDGERIISKEELVNSIELITGININELITNLSKWGGVIRESNNKSFTLSIARFLDEWVSDNDLLRVIKRNKRIEINLFCLDVSKYTEPVINESWSTVLMSATLKPIKMYKEVLGINNPIIIELTSPFPPENKLTIINPSVTTRYSKRSEEEYNRIAMEIAKVINNINVNTAIFFPSYNLLNSVHNHLTRLTSKNMIIEVKGLNKEEKDLLINKFKNTRGSILLGVVSGSFGEGVDLPGEELECVIIVGLPLPVPDLITKSLINHYQERFGNGWDYAYTYPAITRVIQSAGRCIRQSSDKGLIILLDERYAWSKYQQCIPSDWRLIINRNTDVIAREFFKQD